VYNGENFLSEALDSLLAQTYRDFELIISDNASTDRTAEICRTYAERDSRIRYYRNEQNLGASRNYTKAFERAMGEYFKWAAHDDRYHERYLEECVAVLDRDPAVVLCHALTVTIDASGRFGKKWPSRAALASGKPHERMREVLSRLETFAIWGLARRSMLATTPLLADYPAHDRPLLTEVALHGKLFEVPEYLFFEREHPGRSVRAFNWRKPHEAVAWYAPEKAGKLIFPAWRLLYEFTACIWRVPGRTGDRVLCHKEVGRWAWQARGDLIRDLVVAGARLPAVGRIVTGTVDWYARLKWTIRTKRLARRMRGAIPTGDAVAIVDEHKLDRNLIADWHLRNFPEHGGEYWGPPASDKAALSEIDRLRTGGTNYIAFAWPAFWWLTHYADLNRHLRCKFRCVFEDDLLIVFDMR
jgi:hypothetical protein